MFTLNRNLISQFNIEHTQEFIASWSGYYKYEIKAFNRDEIISYKDELNLQNNLTMDNVKNLLRWKDPKYLTEIIMTGPRRGQSNIRVLSVLENLDKLNKFRNDELSYEEFRITVNNIFPTGIIWQIFLFHISKPAQYPIADKNVFRVYDLYTNTSFNISWEKYNDYMGYFFELVDQYNLLTNNLTDYVIKLKKVDNALFVFGKFLKTYY